MAGPLRCPGLARVLRLFPQERERIFTLAAESESFAAACEDYELVIATIHRLGASLEEDDERLQEYRCLARELEREIAAVLARKRP